MGEPAELSNADRAMVLATALAVVDSVRDDEAFPIAGVATDDAKMLVLTLCQRILELANVPHGEAVDVAIARAIGPLAGRQIDPDDRAAMAHAAPHALGTPAPRVSVRAIDGAYTVGPPPDGRPVAAHLDALMRAGMFAPLRRLLAEAEGAESPEATIGALERLATAANTIRERVR